MKKFPIIMCGCWTFSAAVNLTAAILAIRFFGIYDRRIAAPALLAVISACMAWINFKRAKATSECWCDRCGARTELEAEDRCDGTGFEDDPKVPNCRSWCNPPTDNN